MGVPVAREQAHHEGVEAPNGEQVYKWVCSTVHKLQERSPPRTQCKICVSLLRSTRECKLSRGLKICDI